MHAYDNLQRNLAHGGKEVSQNIVTLFRETGVTGSARLAEPSYGGRFSNPWDFTTTSQQPRYTLEKKGQARNRQILGSR